MKKIYLYMNMQVGEATMAVVVTNNVNEDIYDWLERHTEIDDIVSDNAIEMEHYEHKEMDEGIDLLYDSINDACMALAKKVGYEGKEFMVSYKLSIRQPFGPTLYGPKMLARKMEKIKNGDKETMLAMFDYYAGRAHNMKKAKEMALLYAGINMEEGLSIGNYETYARLSQYMMHIKHFDDETKQLIVGLFAQILSIQDEIDHKVVKEYLELSKTLIQENDDLTKILLERVNEKDRNAMVALGLIPEEEFEYEDDCIQHNGGKLSASYYLAEIFNRCYDDGNILQYLRLYYFYGIGVKKDERILTYIDRCIERKKVVDNEIEKRLQLFQDLQFEENNVDRSDYNLENIDMENIWGYEQEDFVAELGELEYYNTFNDDNNSLTLLYKVDKEEMAYFMSVVDTWEKDEELHHLWDMIIYRLCIEIEEENIEAEYTQSVMSIIDRVKKQ